jgi:cell division protein FtsL
MTKFEKIFYTALIVLTIFTIGVQFGIQHGRDLQKTEDQRQERMLLYIFQKLANYEVNNGN